MSAKQTGLLILFFSLFFCLSCAAKEKEDKDHFGTSVNFPTFESGSEFCDSLSKALDVIAFHQFEGEPLDMEWMDPAFREKLCLVVTINNHCGGG